MNHEGGEEGIDHEGGEAGMNHEGGEEGILPGMITTVPSVAGTRRAKKGQSSRVSLRHFGRRLELESVFRVLRAYCGDEPDVYLG